MIADPFGHRRTTLNTIHSIGLLATTLLPLASAQDPGTLAELLEKKLASPWLKRADWFLDYDKALAAAKRDRKLIFAYFTRSYAP